MLGPPANPRIRSTIVTATLSARRRRCQEAFFHRLNTLQARTGHTDLTLAGGRAMNSVANGKVRRSTLFQRLYVQSAAGDAGGAIGAAYWTWHRLGGARSFVMDHAYLGAAF
jgi:carbamoyltransferase